MKSAFAISWKRSVQPRKQKKYRFNAPLHVKGKFLRARLAEGLQKKYSVKTLRVRKDDKVKVLRGQFKGKTGTVERVDLARERLYITGVEMIRKEGSKALYPVHASKVEITTLGGDDKRRIEIKNG